MHINAENLFLLLVETLLVSRYRSVGAPVRKGVEGVRVGGDADGDGFEGLCGGGWEVLEMGAVAEGDPRLPV